MRTCEAGSDGSLWLEEASGVLLSTAAALPTALWSPGSLSSVGFLWGLPARVAV